MMIPNIKKMLFQVDSKMNHSIIDDSPIQIGCELTIPDNQASALEIKEGSNVYIKFSTENGGELVSFSKQKFARPLPRACQIISLVHLFQQLF